MRLFFDRGRLTAYRILRLGGSFFYHPALVHKHVSMGSMPKCQAREARHFIIKRDHAHVRRSRDIPFHATPCERPPATVCLRRRALLQAQHDILVTVGRRGSNPFTAAGGRVTDQL